MKDKDDKPKDSEKQDDASAKSKAELPAEDDEKKDPKKLSKEEQMALFEESLKNEDWGHQPC